MANDCLVTTLKKTVDNDNLKKLGVIRINVNVTDASKTFSFHASQGNKSRISIISGPDGGQFLEVTAGSPIERGTSFYLDTYSTTYKFSATGKYVLEIDNKYYITKFISRVGTNFDNDDLKYCTRITDITLPNNSATIDLDKLSKLSLTNILVAGGTVKGNIASIVKQGMSSITLPSYNKLEGNLSAFSGNTSINEIILYASPKIEGDVSNLIGCTALTGIQLRNTAISGSLASFLNNGALTNPNLRTISVANTPNLTKNAEDVTALRNLGVTVTIS